MRDVVEQNNKIHFFSNELGGRKYLLNKVAISNHLKKGE